MKPLKVKGVVSHHAIHNDELLALWFAITFGEKLFLGIRTALLTLVDSGIRLLRGKTGAQWFDEGYPCLGTCGGPLDEHDLPVEKRANTSAATLMAEMLNIAGYGPVQAMLEHAVRVDRTATAAGFDISALIKAWHRNDVAISRVRRMFDRSTEARFNVLSGRIRNTNWKSRPNLNRLTTAWLINVAGAKYTGPKSFATAAEAAEALGISTNALFGPVLDYLQPGKHDEDDVFGLAGTVTALNKDGADPGFIRDFVFISLDAKLEEQIRFLKAYDELHDLREARRLYVSGTPLRIIRVASANTEVNRAARMLDKNYDVFIQRNPDGHVVIWYNKKHNMDQAVARLRTGDRNRRRMPKLALDTLKSEGTLPEAPWWYYNPANGQVMCGSLTNKSTPVTKLDDNAIVQCIVNGLAPAPKSTA